MDVQEKPNTEELIREVFSLIT